jgi:ATP-binding cassette subfamily B protein/subfamily B ATP-binding cassette protein MsbA
MIMVVLWFGGTLILHDNATIDAPTFIFFMIILYSVLNPLKELARAGYNIPKGMASVERVDKIMKAENNIKEKPDAKEIASFDDRIEFRNVHFSYVNGKEVIHGVDLTVPKGQTIAIVGQSGSGKSTLVDLIPRYHDVTSGELLIDGTNVKDLKIHSLRSLIGNVNQEAILFNDTIFNNIAFGVENANGTGHRRGEDSQRPRLHNGEGGRLRHNDRRPRREAFRRPEAEDKHCQGDTQEPADPDTG